MNTDPLKNSSTIDWARIDAMNDEDIDTSDIPPLDDSFFATAQLRMPNGNRAKVPVTLDVDAEVLEWFQSQGKEFRARMNAALRLYAKVYQER